MPKYIQVLTVIALVMVIGCCTVWLMDRPGRYQPLGAVGGYYSFDTKMGTIDSFVAVDPSGNDVLFKHTVKMNERH